MKKLLLLISFLLISSPAFCIPKNMQAEQYMRGAKKAVRAQNYTKALEYFEKIKKLDIKLPTAFFYFYGIAKQETGKPIEAKHNLDSYLTVGGHKSKYYHKALDLLEKVDEDLKKFDILSKGYFKDFSFENEGVKVKNTSLNIESCILTSISSEQYLEDAKQYNKLVVHLKNLVLITKECNSYSGADSSCEVQLVTCGPNPEEACAKVSKWKKEEEGSWAQEQDKVDELNLQFGEQKEAALLIKDALIATAKDCKAELMEELNKD